MLLSLAQPQDQQQPTSHHHPVTHLDRYAFSPAAPGGPSAAAAASLLIRSRMPLKPPLGALPSGPPPSGTSPPDRRPVRLSTAAAPSSVCASGATRAGAQPRPPQQSSPAAAAGASSPMDASPCRPWLPGAAASKSPETMRECSGTCGDSVVTGARALGDPLTTTMGCCSAKGLGEPGLLKGCRTAAGWWPTPVVDSRWPGLNGLDT